MKKRILPLLLSLFALLPAAGGAQELPQLFDAVNDGLKQGLEAGAAMAYAGMTQELTLALAPQDERIEEGKAIRLTITAGNPRPQETGVVFALKLPERLACAQDAVWEAVLPAAQMDEERGTLAPSVTTFTREIMLKPGGADEETEIEMEMSMGTRFYRASVPLKLCVADVSAGASVQGVSEDKLQPGDAFAYEVQIANAGSAPKDVRVEMVLPQGVTLDAALPSGFQIEKNMIVGSVRAEAASDDGQGAAPFSASISLPVRVAQDALENDEDAARLLAGALRVDGKRVPLPRVQVCGAKISAQLLSDTDSLKAGETAQLRMVVVNSGLAPANVRLSCVLPQGLKLADRNEEEATPDEAGAALPDKDDGQGGAGVAAVSDQLPTQPAASLEDRTLVYDLVMEAAQETDEGVTASTKVIEIEVAAQTKQEKIQEQLVGTTLAWTVDEGETQLGEAVAMRVYRPAFLGIAHEDWNGLFWAGLLLMVTISLLYAAIRSDDKEEDFCCE